MRLVKTKKNSERKEWGCPRTKNRSNWCHRWCTPKRGLGDCGRLAPHGMLGKTQQAILMYKLSKNDVAPSEPPRAVSRPRPLTRRARRRLRVVEFLEARDLAGLRALARKEATVASTLVACLNELNDVVRWRAIEGLGWVAADMAEDNLDRTRDLVRRLFWSMTEECGGTAWHAAEGIGEILARVPELAPDFASVLASNHDEDPFQDGVVWGLRRLASVRPDLVRKEADVLLDAAVSDRPAKRGHAAAALAHLDLVWSVDVLDSMSSDSAEVQEYDRHDGTMRKTTVGAVAWSSLKAIVGRREPELERQSG